MVTEKINMFIEVIASDDGKNTYEIKRSWSDKGKVIVIELYPMVSLENVGYTDSSAMHLLNHAAEMELGEIRIINLYSQVFEQKPSVSLLKGDNLAYIEDVLESDDIKDYSIVIAWGSSLSSHEKTIALKSDLLIMLKDKGLQDKVKCIFTDNMFSAEQYGVHPLFLGLRNSKDKWYLCDYPLEDELNKYNELLKDKHKNSVPKKKGVKNVPKDNE